MLADTLNYLDTLTHPADVCAAELAPIVAQLVADGSHTYKLGVVIPAALKLAEVSA